MVPSVAGRPLTVVPALLLAEIDVMVWVEAAELPLPHATSVTARSSPIATTTR